MPEAAGALLALWNDVDPAVDAPYNDWHAHEHVPERCTVPGILWGRRYRCDAGSAMPQYLTLYGLRDPQVLDSEPYQRLLREPTPMSRTMRPALRNVSRWVCRLVENTTAVAGNRLAVWTLAGDAAQARDACAGLAQVAGVRGGHLLAERIPEARPLPWLSGTQGQGIEGRWLLCSDLDTVEPTGPPWSAATVYARLPVG